MWLTSKSPHLWRTALCSAVMPVGYWTGISKPAKGTILAPSATWKSWNGVRFSMGWRRAEDDSQMTDDGRRTAEL